MSVKFVDVAFAILIGSAAVLILVSVTLDISNSKWQAEVIRRGYAIHCPLDGKFAWNGECDAQR